MKSNALLVLPGHNTTQHYLEPGTARLLCTRKLSALTEAWRWNCGKQRFCISLQNIPQDISDNLDYIVKYFTYKIVWVADLGPLKWLFWIGIRAEWATTSEMTLNTVLLFCATYSCEVVFSALMTVKSKYWSTWKTLKKPYIFPV